jgi:hypothetical protein
MWREISALWTSLGDGAYLHLLLEPLPLYGTALGLLLLLGSLVLKDVKLRLVALGMIALACFSVWPATTMRRQTEPSVLQVTDSAYHPLIQAQTLRREGASWLYYALGVTSLAAAALGHRGKGALVMMCLLLLGPVVVMHALYLHKKECEVFHRNLVQP